MSDHPDPRQTTGWTALLESIGIHQITAREIRAESFFLGNRHKGRIVPGAQLELAASDVPARRRALLRAVIRAAPDAGEIGQ